jgi:hypothetical protein
MAVLVLKIKMTSEGKVHKFHTIKIEGVETNFPMVHIEFNFSKKKKAQKLRFG